MNINTIFSQTGTQKTASDATPPTPSAPASAAVRSAVAEALAPTEKNASAANPPEATLLKMAQELASREKLAELDHAYRIGEAQGRGFLDYIARAEKVAAAFEQGAQTQAKLAEAEEAAAMEAGAAEMLNKVRTKAAEHYLAGYSMFEGLL